MANEDFEIVIKLKNLRTVKCYIIKVILLFSFWSQLAFWNLELCANSTITWKTTELMEGPSCFDASWHNANGEKVHLIIIINFKRLTIRFVWNLVSTTYYVFYFKDWIN